MEHWSMPPRVWKFPPDTYHESVTGILTLILKWSVLVSADLQRKWLVLITSRVGQFLGLFRFQLNYCVSYVIWIFICCVVCLGSVGYGLRALEGCFHGPTHMSWHT
jgi:hypothetical protein